MMTTALALLAALSTLKQTEVLPARTTVSIVTEVEHGDNSYKAPSVYFDSMLGNGHTFITPDLSGGEDREATERWQITRKFKATTLSTVWRGERLTYTRKELISATTNRWQLVPAQWKESQ